MRNELTRWRLYKVRRKLLEQKNAEIVDLKDKVKRLEQANKLLNIALESAQEQRNEFERRLRENGQDL